MRDELIARISTEGPLPFEEFMRTALYDPVGGFFAGAVLRSDKEGDFLTSPEVSPMFGETLAALVKGEARRIGTDAPDIVEVGAGSGSLLRPLLDAAGAAGGVWAVERSPAARASLAARVPEATVADDLAAVPGGRRGVVLANELLDNLPAALAVRTREGWDEQWVGISDGGLVLVAVPARPGVAAWASAHSGDVDEGGRVEVQIEAGEWVAAALGLLEAGALVVIDYGDTAEGLRHRRADGTLRTYRKHHLGPDPLLEPGATDITMDVAFTAMMAAATAAGAEVSLQRQDDFLSELGLEERLAALRQRELELARSGDAIARLQVRSRLADGRTLLHPRGLGDFRAMVARV
ncbi:MAG: SAM-dependent methyltransferase [Acidimicrobiia bacterium]|nr:SAM-dependent methyltransferase [Acidimicrobiia bacterium]